MKSNIHNSKNNGQVISLISFGDIRAAGIRAVSALLKDRGWASNIIIYKVNYAEEDIPTKKEEDILIDLLKGLKTDFVGLSVKTPFLQTAKKITRRIKDELDATVIWGGSHPTIMPEESIRIADIICIGEGEYPFLELIEKSANEESIDNIKNLWIRHEDRIVRNGVRDLLQREDMNTLPYLDCGGEGKYTISGGVMTREDPLNKTLEYYPMASRGCPFTCSYCINGVLRDLYKGHGTFVRSRSPENVVDELVNIKNRFPLVKRFRFQDEVFPWHKEWIKKFCLDYKKRVGLPFLCTFHPNTINDESVSMLKDAGLMVVGLGMQSPSSRVRREVFHRPETDVKLMQAIEILHRHSIDGFYDIILDNPFETIDDKKEGLDFLLKMPKPFNITAFSLKFFPGYKITDESIKSGLIDDSEVEAISSKGYFEMNYNWYSPRVKEDVFWNCLYLLSSKNLIPCFLVKEMSKSQFLANHPGLLVFFIKIIWYPDLLVMVTRRLIRGQLNPVNLMRVIISRIRKRTI